MRHHPKILRANSEDNSAINLKRHLDVAVLIDTSSQWSRQIIMGINRYKSAMRVPWNLLIEPHGPNELVSLPKGWRGAGVIASIRQASLARKLLRLNLPVVNVSDEKMPVVSRFSTVSTDRILASRLAADYFLRKGFCNFAYIGLKNNGWDTENAEYYVRALHEAGIEKSHIIQIKSQAWGAPDWNTRIDRLGSWLQKLPRPLAVFSWGVGREVISACRYVGLKVPEDVSLLLLGYDEIFSEVGYTPISGILHAWDEIGYQAAELLDLSMCKPKASNAAPVVKKIAPVTVVERQSTDVLAISDSRMVRAMSFIRENATHSTSVNEVAVHVGLSRRMLERLFFKFVGRSPAEQIRFCQFEKAKSLLRETKLSIPNVAESAGFSSAEYMATAFRRELGLTPLTYRKRGPI